MSVDQILSRLRNVKRAGSGWTALCPAHDDRRENSLSIGIGSDDRILLNCFAGCQIEEIVKALGLEMKDLFPDRSRDGWTRGEGSNPSVSREIVKHPPGLTLAALAEAKKLSEAFLRELGVTEVSYLGSRVVRIPYTGPSGELLAVRFRLALDGPRRFVWRSGDKVALYGLERLKAIREAGWVLLVEGESDCWTARYHELPALGIPGKSCWRSSWREHLDGLAVYLWQEPGAEGLSLRVAADVPGLRIIPAPDGIKDLSEAHIRGHVVAQLAERLKATAVPAERLQREQADARIAELRKQAEPVLKADDPVELVRDAIGALGYGGDLRPPVIVYLATTSRLLKMRPGSMPVHLLLLGLSSVGKSYSLRIVLSLLPPEAYHEIDAGSPRVLIYDDAHLRHRVVIFAEADSLPVGEDNPAASAIRNLLQEHQLRYQVTIRDAETGDYRVREVAKPGPTVLITSAVRRLGPQLDTRLFALDVPDDVKQVREALATQAQIETEGIEEPDPALIAFQAYLQALAPWDVVVPFASALAKAVGQSVVGPRILRDFSRLLSLIKTVAVLRHRRRRVDAKGRLIAEVDDYEVVYELVKDMYEATVTGADEKIRAVVQGVKVLQAVGPVTVTALASHMGASKASISRRVKVALTQGWLVNGEQRKGYPADLKIGEPLPDPSGLPHPDALRGCFTVSSDTGGQDTPFPSQELREVVL